MPLQGWEMSLQDFLSPVTTDPGVENHCPLGQEAGSVETGDRVGIQGGLTVSTRASE